MMHLRARVVNPEANLGMALCDMVNGTLTPGRLCDGSGEVDCSDCLEIIHS